MTSKALVFLSLLTISISACAAEQHEDAAEEVEGSNAEAAAAGDGEQDGDEEVASSESALGACFTTTIYANRCTVKGSDAQGGGLLERANRHCRAVLGRRAKVTSWSYQAVCSLFGAKTIRFNCCGR